MLAAFIDVVVFGAYFTSIPGSGSIGTRIFLFFVPKLHDRLRSLSGEMGVLSDHNDKISYSQY